MRKLREQAVQERMVSIETPLLQFDDDELNPKPFIYEKKLNNEDVCPPIIDLSYDKLEKKPSEALITCPLLESKEINPQFEWGIHTLEELNHNITNESKDTKSNSNNQALENANNNSICQTSEHSKVNENYYTSFDTKSLANFENNSTTLDSEGSALVDDVATKRETFGGNNLQNKEIALTFEGCKENVYQPTILNKCFNGDANNTISKDMVKTSCVQEVDTTHEEVFLYQKPSDNLGHGLHDLHELKDIHNNEYELHKNNNITTIEVCTTMCTTPILEDAHNNKHELQESNDVTTNEGNINLSLESTNDMKELQDPMYLYLLNDDEQPIPRFLSISKAHKRRNLTECNINDHLPTNQLHGNEVSISESITVKKKYLEKLLVKETLEIEEGSGNHKILNCEKSHVDDQINSIILTTELEILEKLDVDKVQENMFTNNYHISKENSSTLPKMELETKSIEKIKNKHDESKTKLGTLCQREIIDDESGKRGSLACETSTKVDGESYSSDSKNATHLDLQQNILPLKKSLPHSLNFKKVQKNEWIFDDESSKVYAEIQNIANENEMNHDQYMFDDHGTIIPQKIDEQL
jgi:hypothetical protein